MRNRKLSKFLFILAFIASYFGPAQEALATNRYYSDPCPVRRAISLGSISDRADRAMTYLSNGGVKATTQSCQQYNRAFRPLVISSQFAVAEVNGKYEGTANFEFVCARLKSNKIPILNPNANCPAGVVQ